MWSVEIMHHLHWKIKNYKNVETIEKLMTRCFRTVLSADPLVQLARLL